MALLYKIEEYKEQLFGKFSERLRSSDKDDIWKKLFDWCSENGYPFVKESNNFVYLRNTVWGSNLKGKALVSYIIFFCK